MDVARVNVGAWVKVRTRFEKYFSIEFIIWGRYVSLTETFWAIFHSVAAMFPFKYFVEPILDEILQRNKPLSIKLTSNNKFRREICLDLRCRLPPWIVCCVSQLTHSWSLTNAYIYLCLVYIHRWLWILFIMYFVIIRICSIVFLLSLNKISHATRICI